MTPDVNVLVAAFRADHSHHSSAHSGLSRVRRDCADGRNRLVLLPMVIVGFLGLVTNRKVFLQPDSIEDAIEFVDAIIAGPGVELRHNLNDWPLFRTALLVNNLSGNLVTDAWIAAATQTASEHLVTFDRDFLQLLPRQDVTILQ